MDVVEVSADLCDSCIDQPVRACVYAEMPSGLTVSYCYHHGTIYLAELTRQATTVIDLRHTLHGH